MIFCQSVRRLNRRLKVQQMPSSSLRGWSKSLSRQRKSKSSLVTMCSATGVGLVKITVQSIQSALKDGIEAKSRRAAVLTRH